MPAAMASGEGLGAIRLRMSKNVETNSSLFLFMNESRDAVEDMIFYELRRTGPLLAGFAFG